MANTVDKYYPTKQQLIEIMGDAATKTSAGLATKVTETVTPDSGSHYTKIVRTGSGTAAGLNIETKAYVDENTDLVSGLSLGASGANLSAGDTAIDLSSTIAQYRKSGDTSLTAAQREIVRMYDLASAIDAAKNGRFIVASQLPTTDIDPHAIYLIPKAGGGSTGNVKEEWIYIPGDPSGSWEKVGDTEIDLSGYATITYVDTALEGKVDKVTGKQLSTEDYTTAEKTKLGGLPDTVNDLSAQDVTDVKAAFSLT